MEKIKEVLEQLNSALFSLQNIVAENEKEKEALRVQKIKQDEIDKKQTAKAEELNKREGEIKHVESIVEATKKAKELMAEAKALMTNANDRQAKLEIGLKQLGEDRAKFNKEKADQAITEKKQSEALKKERDEFEKKVKIFNNALSMTSANIKG